MARKPGDPLPRDSRELVVRYCATCKYLAKGTRGRYCKHEGRRFDVALLGGGSALHRVCQTLVDGKMVRWDERGEHLLFPWPAFVSLHGSFTRHFEAYDPDPPHEDEPTWFYGKLLRITTAAERIDTGRMLWAGIPRHALARYRMKERTYKGKKKTTMSKVRQVLADRPCFCWQGQRCEDYDRRRRWLDEHGQEMDPQHKRYVETSPLFTTVHEPHYLESRKTA